MTKTEQNTSTFPIITELTLDYLRISESEDLCNKDKWTLLWQGEWEFGYLQLAFSVKPIFVNSINEESGEIESISYPVYYKFIGHEITIAGSILVDKIMSSIEVVPYLCNRVRESYDSIYKTLSAHEAMVRKQNGETFH